MADSASEGQVGSWVLENPQVVNGLQTSHVIHESSLANAITKKRLKETILVRIVEERDPAIRESIITGTNNQTNVTALQLYANDDIQHHIEKYLKTKGWFYERRRWQYRGSSTPASRIKTMNELAQAVIAVKLLEPDTARARPRTLLGKTSGYSSVFSDAFPEVLYSKSLDLLESIEDYLGSEDARKISDDLTNDRYYIAAGYVIRNLRLQAADPPPPAAALRQLKAKASAKELNAIHKSLYVLVAKAPPTKTRDALFKGKDLKADFFAEMIKQNKKEKKSGK